MTLEIGVKKIRVQRDGRTEMWVKKAYTVLAFITSIALIITSVGLYLVRDQCSNFKDGFDTTEKSFHTLTFFGFTIGAVLFILSIVFMSLPNWAWMTTSFKTVKGIGQDVEDPDPYILAKSGQDMLLRGYASQQRIDVLAEESYNN